MKKLKFPHLNLLPLIVLSFILLKLIFEADISFSAVFSFIYSCIAYFVWGIVIAYLFNPLMVFFDKLIASKKDSPKMKKIKRGGVIAFLYLMFIGVITIFVVAFIPTVKEGIQEILDRMPEYVSTARKWSLNSFGIANPQLEKIIDDYFENGLGMLYSWLSGIDLNHIGTSITSAVSGSAMAVIRIVFGLVISVYVLYSKETLLLEVKKLIHALFSTERASKIIKNCKNINDIFMNFVASKVLESTIIFIIGLFVLNLIDIPIAALISLVIAVTNIIPYFGPYIGAIPSILITLMFDPLKALWVLLYAIGIQIVDNLIIGPKVMADQVGISPLLVIAGVTFGSALGGIFGMFIGVPVAAVIKLVFYDPFIERRLVKKRIDAKTCTVIKKAEEKDNN